MDTEQATKQAKRAEKLRSAGLAALGAAGLAFGQAMGLIPAPEPDCSQCDCEEVEVAPVPTVELGEPTVPEKAAEVPAES